MVGNRGFFFLKNQPLLWIVPSTQLPEYYNTVVIAGSILWRMTELLTLFQIKIQIFYYSRINTIRYLVLQTPFSLPACPSQTQEQPQITNTELAIKE